MRKGLATVLADALATASNAPGTELAEAALVIARLEYPQLDASAYLSRLDRMGDAARRRIERQVDETGDGSTRSCIKGLNAYLFDDQRFVGNRDRYEDPCNSCLNEVLDRRTGIPITLSVVYLEIGRRAGLRIDGVNFPGHFLVRVPENTDRGHSRLIIDPFDGGAIACRNTTAACCSRSTSALRSPSAGRCSPRPRARRSSSGYCST